MARPAEVLYQRSGEGVILFAGQTVPALAIRADKLKELHNLAKAVATSVREGTTQTKEFRSQVQELHLEIATMMLRLQDAALRHHVQLNRNLQIRGSDDFVRLD